LIDQQVAEAETDGEREKHARRQKRIEKKYNKVTQELEKTDEEANTLVAQLEEMDTKRSEAAAQADEKGESNFTIFPEIPLQEGIEEAVAYLSATATDVQATLQGFQYSIEHNQETADLLEKYEHKGYTTPGHEEYILQHQHPYIFDGTHPIGWMEQSRWQQSIQSLLESGILNGQVNVEDIHTTSFLEEIYG